MARIRRWWRAEERGRPDGRPLFSHAEYGVLDRWQRVFRRQTESRIPDFTWAAYN